MLLTIDVGNTNMVFGLFEGERLAASFRLKTDAERTADEIGLLVCGYFQRFGYAPEGVCDVVIASVVPQVMHALGAAMLRYFGKKPLVVDVDLDPGLPYGVASNERLGADRAVADIAACAKYGAPLIVLDFGTATTVDAVRRDGQYLGGCITAGLRVAAEALVQKAPLLPRVELVAPATVLGTTAVGQLQAGTVLGYIGAMEALIRRTRAEMDDVDIKVIATGGLAQLVARNTPLIDIVDDSLILDGLQLLYARARG